jgi:serine/threonine protein phosphatase 1
VLFLGDIIDRGPWSRQSMDLVSNTLDRWPQSRLILGNHDAYFLDFMTAEWVDEARYTKWLLRLGGYETLDSYGLIGDCGAAETAARFRARFPRHLQVLQQALPIVVDQRFAYVHAGIDTTRSLADQDPKDLRLIRDGFLDYDGPLSHVIVHGHTPTHQPVPGIRPNRICIDQAAYWSGVLTCMCVSSDERDINFLFAKAVRMGSVEVQTKHMCEYPELSNNQQERM